MLENKNYLFFSCLFVFLLSIFLRSTMDVGADTSFYIGYGKKIYEGGRYYYDFFESNFPASFYIYAFFYKISLLTKIHPVFISEFFINFLGLCSILFSYKILEFKNDNIKKNLIIFAFFVGYFLRIGSLQLGEFGTKTSFLLMLLFPYISFSITEKKIDKKLLVVKGILMGLIPCFKPNYAIFLIIIESYKLYQRKSLKFFLEIDKLSAFLVLFLYLNFLLFCVPEFLEFMVPMWSQYYPSYSSVGAFFKNFSKVFSYSVFPALFILPFYIYKKDDKILLLFLLSAALVLMTEGLASIDQVAVFRAVLTILLLNFAFYFFASKKFSLKDNKFIAILILIFPILDDENFFSAMFGFVNIWYFVAFAYLFYLFKKGVFDCKKTAIFTGLILVCALISNLALRNFEYVYAYSIFLVFSAIFLYIFEAEFSKKSQKFSPFFAIIFMIVFSYFIHLCISSVRQVIFRESTYATPNEFTDKIAYNLAKYTKGRQESYLTISNLNMYAYPMYIYLNKQDYYKYAVVNAFNPPQKKENRKMLFSLKNPDKVFLYDYLYEDFKLLLKNKNIKIIFVDNSSGFLNGDESCGMSLLEQYFKDKKFKQEFLSNFVFKDRIEVYKDEKEIRRIRFGKFSKLKKAEKQKINDFEVYVRK
jgi:hypothetical protein